MVDWKRWGGPDPAAAATGISFDMTEAGEIRAPAGMLRVCAYHFDWDHRPFCYVDVDTLEQAKDIVARLDKLKAGWNVDYAVVHDPTGAIVHHNRPW